MKKLLHLLFICFLALIGLEKANAENVVYKTLDFTKASYLQTVNNYQSSWKAEEDGNIWSLYQFNNYDGQWKCAACGSKERNTTPYIVNLQPFTKAITKIEITFNGVPSNILNSFVIYTGPDATISNHEFELNEHINKYVYKTSINNGIVTYTIAQPQKNSYYKLLWNLNKDKENGNIIIGKIVYYTSSVQSPDFSGGTAFLNNTTVTLSSIDEGAKIYYTTDGTEPTDKSTEYTAPFTLNTTTTVKAISYLNGDKSNVVSQTYKKVEDSDLIPVAQALKAADNAQVYVKAKVAKTDTYNSKYPTLNYYIANTEDPADTLEVLNGRYLQDAAITKADQIVCGDEVTLAATLYNHKGKKELRSPLLLSIKEYQDKATVSAAGWATFVSRRAVDFSKASGLSAYTVKYDATANQVILSPVTAIPGNTAVVVKANAGTYDLQRGETSTIVENNDLTFSWVDKKVTAPFTIYVLAKQGDGCGFYPVKANEILAPFKGYLTINAASSAAKPFYAIGGNTTAGINTVEKAKNMESVHYNLAGQRVNDNYQGLVIVNGHKVIMK